VSDPGQVEGVLLRRPRFLQDLGTAVGLLGVATSFLVREEVRLPWIIGFGTTGIALALMGRDGGAHRVQASVRDGAVAVGERVVVPRRTIRSAWIERSYHGRRVHVDRGLFPDVELEAADEAEARALLRALRCDPSQAVVSFPFPSRLAALAGAIGGQLCAHALVGRDGVFTPEVLLLSMVSCFVWYFLFSVFGRDVTSIGSDGVLLSGLLRSRFIPFADIESAEVVAAGKLVLRLRRSAERKGREVVRWMRGPAGDAAAELIQTAITPAHAGSEAVRRRLRCEAGDAGAWIARLRALALDEPYRAAAFAGESLWRVVDDPSATGAERVAAAVVLGAAATDGERARLREVAARMASPRVRIAIERVADAAGDQELAAAMAAVSTRDSAA
jgi:hypothetical protein